MYLDELQNTVDHGCNHYELQAEKRLICVHAGNNKDYYLSTQANERAEIKCVKNGKRAEKTYWRLWQKSPLWFVENQTIWMHYLLFLISI